MHEKILMEKNKTVVTKLFFIKFLGLTLKRHCCDRNRSNSWIVTVFPFLTIFCIQETQFRFSFEMMCMFLSLIFPTLQEIISSHLKWRPFKFGISMIKTICQTSCCKECPSWSVNNYHTSWWFKSPYFIKIYLLYLWINIRCVFFVDTFNKLLLLVQQWRINILFTERNIIFKNKGGEMPLIVRFTKVLQNQKEKKYGKCRSEVTWFWRQPDQ